MNSFGTDGGNKEENIACKRRFGLNSIVAGL
jgi:hypothetical protein